MVKKKEQKNWKHVTADMMSEEELDTGDSGFIRHRPAWRSQHLSLSMRSLLPSPDLTALLMRLLLLPEFRLRWCTRAVMTVQHMLQVQGLLIIVKKVEVKMIWTNVKKL